MSALSFFGCFSNFLIGRNYVWGIMSGLAKLFLSQNHLKAIGLVAAEWSYTEMCLEHLIWEMAGLDNQRGYAITTHVPSETRMHILETLADTRLPNDALKKKLKTTVADLRTPRMERNNIVHALWLSSKPNQFLMKDVLKKRKPIPASIKIQAKGKLNITNKPIISKQIQATAVKIGKLVTKMYNLL